MYVMICLVDWYSYSTPIQPGMCSAVGYNGGLAWKGIAVFVMSAQCLNGK